jgi:hypothetical protein
MVRLAAMITAIDDGTETSVKLPGEFRNGRQEVSAKIVMEVAGGRSARRPEEDDDGVLAFKARSAIRSMLARTSLKEDEGGIV